MTRKSNNETGFSKINKAPLKSGKERPSNRLEYSIHLAITQEMKDFLVYQAELGYDKGEVLRNLLQKEMQDKADLTEDYWKEKNL